MNKGMSEIQDINIHYYGFHRENTEACVSRSRNEGKVYLKHRGQSFVVTVTTYNSKSLTLL